MKIQPQGIVADAQTEDSPLVLMKGPSMRNLNATLLGWVLALLVTLAIAPDAAIASRNNDGPQGGNGTGLLAANETIGTLPTWWVADDAVLPLTFLGQLFETFSSQVSFEAYVAEDEVQELFVDGTGVGFALLNYTGAWVHNQPQVRVRVFGQVTLGLDLAAAGTAGVSTVTRIGSAFKNGWLQWSTGFQLSSLVPVASIGDGLALDLQTPEGLALIEAGPLALTCFSGNGDSAGARATKVGDMVVYTQTL